jgi:signal transduction histidine kinase
MTSGKIYQWMRWGGLFASLAVGLSGQLDGWNRPNGPIQPLWNIAWFLYIVTTVLFVLNTRDFPARRRWHPYVLLAQMLVSVPLALSYEILTAISIPLVTSGRNRLRWLAALGVCVLGNMAVYLGSQWTPLVKVMNKEHKWPELTLDVGVGLLETYAWITLAYLAATLIVRMDDDRRRVASINAELLSSRTLLAESSRLAERLEISRELHDSLGHHLTTLNLELEIALYASAAEKDPQIAKAQFLARLLLAELRDAVGSWRRETSVALPDALRCLASGVSGLKVALEIDPALPPLDAGRAHALLRCSQEAVTNALRHAAAQEVRIFLGVRIPGEIQLEVADDGQGSPAICRGTGLSGIAERAAEFHGRADFNSPPGGGFLVRVTLPCGVTPA